MILSPGRILVCFTRVDGGDAQARRAVLSTDELKKADAFRFEKDRLLSITARAQIRYLLSELTGEPADSFSFVLGEGGKPAVRPGTPGAEISFSLSHTRGMVLSALALKTDLGVDLERLDRKVDPDMAGRFFSASETRQITEAPEDERSGLFLRLWTLKEAWIKAWGKGLSMGLDSISFDLESTGPIRWTLADGQEAGGWQFFQFSPVPGTVAALAAGTEAPVQLETYQCFPFDGLRSVSFDPVAVSE